MELILRAMKLSPSVFGRVMEEREMASRVSSGRTGSPGGQEWYCSNQECEAM